MNPQVIDNLAPIAVLIFFFAIAYFALQFRHRGRALRHAERMTALEKGIDLPPDPQPSGKALGPKAYLLRGLIWISIGAGVVIFFLSLRLAEPDNHLFAIATLGLIPIGVGVSHLAIYRLETRH